MYDYKEELNVSIRKEYNEIAYSDGVSAEKLMYEKMLKIEDRSTFSEEIKNSISDWMTEYHFERKRHLLLRPFEIDDNSSVLEVGCGCGAITRYLGETKADIDAVEGTLNRAKIAGLRCIDLPNVKIFVDDFINFEIEKKYDYVLFIGVLEYASKYHAGSEPVIEYLKKAKKFLKPNGKIVIAIENALGLKYFNWCGEDHLNKKFVALDNLYDDNDIKTYGRLEWIDMLRKAELEKFEFFFPFPDYKLPTDIVSEEAFCDKNFDVAAILSRTPSRDYTGVEDRIFSEEAAFISLCRNGIMKDVSNSFLIVCGTQEFAKSRKLAWSFSVDRVKSYCTSTIFEKTNESIYVDKSKIFGEMYDSSKNLSKYKLVHKTGRSEYICGKYYLQDLLSSAQNYNSFYKFSHMFIKWAKHILEKSTLHGDPNKLESYKIDGSFLDAIPQNYLIYNKDFHLIDQEWYLDGDIPTGWILFRGLANSLRNRVVGNELFRTTFSELSSYILSNLSLTFEHESGMIWADLECSLSNIVYNNNICGKNANIEEVFKIITRRRLEDILSEQILYISQLRYKIDTSREILKY